VLGYRLWKARSEAMRSLAGAGAGWHALRSRVNRGSRDAAADYADLVQLTKWVRNNVFKAIEAAGLDPAEFDWDGNFGSALTHVPSGAHFVFGGEFGHYEGTYQAGDSPEWPYEVYSPPSLLKRVEGWLSDLKLDLDTPDLWGELRSERELLGGAYDEVGNTPFTPEERTELARQLGEIKEYVKKTYSLSKEQTEALERKLEYLEEATGRLGRIDWRTAFLGAMMEFLLVAALSPETARDVFAMGVRTLGHLFGHPIPELPSG
jgi:hypothetical protein